MIGVAGAGAYVPRFFLTSETYADAWDTGGPSGVDRTAVPDADEDALTMAVEAGRRALAAAGVDSGQVTRLALATTNPPVEEGDTVARLASLLGISDDATTRQYGGGTQVGVAALADAFATGGPAVVVAADCPRGSPESDEEAAAGAGAGALVLTEDGPLTATATGEFTEPSPGTRFRRRGRNTVESLGVTAYERDAYRTAVVGAVEDLAADVSDVDAAAMTAPDGSLPYRTSESAGISDEQIAAGTAVSETGDTGAAGPLIGLAAALEGGASRALVVGYGDGATAALLDGPDQVPAETALSGDVELSYAAFLRQRGDVTGGAPEGGGAYVSVPSWRRTIPQRHRLVAGRCSDCGALAFPPEGACSDCGALADYEAVELERAGTVEAVTTVGQGGAPPEFVEQQQRAGAFAVAVVAFDGPDGGAVSAPVQVVSSPAGAPDVGDRVVAVPRRVYEQEGVARYGLKVVPEAVRR